MKFQLLEPLNLSVGLFVKTKAKTKTKASMVYTPVTLAPERAGSKDQGQIARPITQ